MSHLSTRVERKRQKRKERNRNLSFWMAQTILSGIFFLSGVLKLFLSVETLAQSDPWIYQAPVPFVRFIGLVELTAGVGLMLPSLLRQRTIWSMRAGFSILLLLLLALSFHIIREEWGAIPTVVVLAAIDMYLLWGRIKIAPIRDEAPSRS